MGQQRDVQARQRELGTFVRALEGTLEERVQRATGQARAMGAERRGNAEANGCERVARQASDYSISSPGLLFFARPSRGALIRACGREVVLIR